MQVTRIFHELRHIKQEQKTVTEYAGEIKKLYRDLEYFRPFKAHDPRDVSLLREWFEPLLVQIFLDGLNSEFNLRSQVIQATPDWPTLDQTIASILEEETRLANQITAPQASIDNRAALSSASQIQSGKDQAGAHIFDYAKRTRGVCEHCKKPGHVKWKCFDLVGYPPGWQKKPSGRFTRGGSSMRRTDRAHFTTSREEQSAVTAQALEEFKAKLMATTVAGPSETTPDTHTEKGATNHMTGSSKFFSTYIPCSGRDRDLNTGRILGTGVEHEGLYYLNNTQAPYALSKNDNDTGSKGENLIKDINDRGNVMVPIVDIIHSEEETEGEKTASTNEEGDNTLIPGAYENLSGQRGVETDDGEGVRLEVDEGAANQPHVLEEAPASEEVNHDDSDDEGALLHRWILRQYLKIGRMQLMILNGRRQCWRK
ncbi:unnamed protein product [Alopecurus aequalis]